MKILLVAATIEEVQPLVSALSSHTCREGLGIFNYKENEIHVLVTSVGVMQTGYYLGKAFAESEYPQALQIGIAGSFDRKIALGEVVLVSKEKIGDLGAEDGDVLLSVEEMQLRQPDQFPYKNGWLENDLLIASHALKDLKKVSSATVNKVLGNQSSIDLIQKKYSPDIINMEGAAFFYACMMNRIPFLEMRSISNYVEPRDKSRWKMEEAIENLTAAAYKYLQTVLK